MIAQSADLFFHAHKIASQDDQKREKINGRRRN